MTIIAFDVGTKKMGVAVGQQISMTASPLEKVNCSPEIDWHKIKKITDEWNPDCFVVGIPTNMDGSEMHMTDTARAFMSELQSRYPDIDTHQVDERLTTKAAKELIFERYGYKGLKSKDIDSVAAALMLEQWMKNHVR